MPERSTMRRAGRARRRGRRPSTQAGEYVRETIHHIRRGKHGARSVRQAIAIGLSKGRRAGVDLPPPKKGATSARTRRSARYAYDAGHGHPHGTSSARRSRAITRALGREPRRAASHRALARQAHTAARRRGHASKSRAARRAVRTKGHAGLARAARKAAGTRARRR